MVLLTTPRLTLRPILKSDLETTFAYAGDTEHVRYMVYLPHASREETEQFLDQAEREWEKEAPNFMEFAVLLGNRHIGGLSIYFGKDAGLCELGWILHREYQGQGYATEAAQAVLLYARDVLKMRRIVAECDARNTASARVMEKLGMTRRENGGMRRNRGDAQDVPNVKYEWVLDA